MKLSVIIPIFNVETTIERCLLSVLAQRVEGTEIILVDDGSEDGSTAIAKRFADENANVRYIHQENQGLSSARNTGIKNSTGEYITFVDSDDYLLDGTFAPLMKILSERTDVDILEYSVVKMRDGKEKRITLPDATYADVRSYWLQGKAYGHTYACNKFFHRSLFALDTPEPLLFKEGIVFEDAEFLGRLLKANPTVVTTSQLGYVYEWNPQGITSTADGNKLASLLATNLHVASQLDLAFVQFHTSRTTVTNEESALYLSLLNIQISVCQQTHSEPILPDCKVRLCHAHSVKMLLKVFMLNTFGLQRLCSLLKP